MQNFKKNKITIVTVVKNSIDKVERCIQSVINQNYDNIEYIIIDGGSNDGTVDIINKYRDKIDKIIIENDNGIWDAMNKGLKIANGDIVGFLNSDDTYNQNTLKIVNNYFNNFKIDFLFGSVKKYKIMHGYSPWKIKYSFGFYTSHSVGFFINLNQHKKVGFYNLKYLSADLDLFYKMIVKYKMKGISSKKKEIFGEFSKGGFSSKIDYMDHLLDLNQIRIDNGQNKFLVYILFLIKILKKPFKFLKSIT